MKKRSNLDIIGAERFTLCFNDFDRSYLPPTGFAAAKMDVRAFNVALQRNTKTIVTFVLKHLTLVSSLTRT